MGFRSKDFIAGIAARCGYRLEPIRRDVGATDALPSEPYAAMRELMGRLGHASPVVFDVGANKGDTAALFRGMFPGSTVHAFEPFPETIAMLRERFGGDGAVRIVEAAVSKEAGRATFHVNHAHATNSLLARPEESERFYPKNAGPKGEIEVATISLDDYCDAQGIERVALLKLDIQGGELMAIGGAQRMLGEGRVDVVYSEIQFVELYEGAAQFDQVWGEMRRLGYWLFDVYDLHRSAGGQLLYGDAMFVSADCRERVLRKLRVDR